MAAPEATAWLKAKLQAAMGSEKGLVEPVMKSAAAQVPVTCRCRLHAAPPLNAVCVRCD